MEKAVPSTPSGAGCDQCSLVPSGMPAFKQTVRSIWCLWSCPTRLRLAQVWTQSAASA